MDASDQNADAHCARGCTAVNDENKEKLKSKSGVDAVKSADFPAVRHRTMAIF